MAERRRSDLKKSHIIRKTIENEDLDKLRTMLEGGLDANEILNGYDPHEPLLHAIVNSKTDEQLFKTVKLLLENRANPDVTHKVNKGGTRGVRWVHRSALHEALARGKTEVVKLLLDAGAKCATSDGFENPLLVALRCKTPPDIIELLLKHGADPNDHDGEPKCIPLLNAIENLKHVQNETNVVRLLLEHGANPNVSHRVNIGGYVDVKWVDRTALHDAVDLGHTEVVRMLLDAGAKCTTSDGLQNPLALAVGHICPADLIELLLKHGADPNVHVDQLKSIPLLNAIRNNKCVKNDRLIIQFLLEYGANPDVTHKVNIAGHGRTKWVHKSALHEAVNLTQTEVVKMLLEAGAKCTSSEGLQNPLELAITKCCPSGLIELLLRHGAGGSGDQLQDNLLFKAIRILNCDLNGAAIVQLLLEYGAKPNVTVTQRVNLEGSVKPVSVHTTPLHEAIRYQWSEGVKVLLDAGAKCTASNKLKDPLALALQGHCPIDLLVPMMEHGADVNCPLVMGVPLIHRLCQNYNTIFPRQLDFFFLQGGNINAKDWQHRLALESAVGHSNTVRWLIRHGAEVLTFTVLRGKFRFYVYPAATVILLQAGMRVSPEAQRELSDMAVRLMEDTEETQSIHKRLWDHSEQAEDEEPQRLQGNQRKRTFPKYCTQQMVDLQEFSDESLQAYQEEEDAYIHPIHGLQWQDILDQIQMVLQFLSQAQSLQWHCRRCVRENLVSLQPSVVKSLPGPARLKRYILCHEL